jgi:hypothetical protein
MYQACFYVQMISCGNFVAEHQLCISWNIARGANNLQVSNKAVTDITHTGMIDLRGPGPDPTGVVLIVLLLINTKMMVLLKTFSATICSTGKRLKEIGMSLAP